MSADLDVRPAVEEGDRNTGTHGRNRLTWLVAAAAVAAIAAGGTFAVNGLSRQQQPGTAGRDTALGRRPRRQRTARRPDHGTRCQRPAGQVPGGDAEILAQYPLAFQGR